MAEANKTAATILARRRRFLRVARRCSSWRRRFSSSRLSSFMAWRVSGLFAGPGRFTEAFAVCLFAGLVGFTGVLVGCLEDKLFDCLFAVCPRFEAWRGDCLLMNYTQLSKVLYAFFFLKKLSFILPVRYPKRSTVT